MAVRKRVTEQIPLSTLEQLYKKKNYKTANLPNMSSFTEYIIVMRNISKLSGKKLEDYMKSIVRFASANEKNKILKLLIKNNLNIRDVDKYGNTPLEIARAYLQNENIKLLENLEGTDFKKTVKKIKMLKPRIIKKKVVKKTKNNVVKKTNKKKVVKKTKKLNKTMCKKFIKDPSVNPLSNRKIKIDGPKYKELLKKCEKLNIKK